MIVDSPFHGFCWNHWCAYGGWNQGELGVWTNQRVVSLSDCCLPRRRKDFISRPVSRNTELVMLGYVDDSGA